jgi:hypothetical protein
MCACTETDVRESANDCILASGEGHGSRGETFHPIYPASPVSSSVEHPVLHFRQWVSFPLIIEMKLMNYNGTSILFLKGPSKINVISRKLQNLEN